MGVEGVTGEVNCSYRSTLYNRQRASSLSLQRFASAPDGVHGFWNKLSRSNMGYSMVEGLRLHCSCVVAQLESGMSLEHLEVKWRRFGGNEDVRIGCEFPTNNSLSGRTQRPTTPLRSHLKILHFRSTPRYPRVFEVAVVWSRRRMSGAPTPTLLESHSQTHGKSPIGSRAYFSSNVELEWRKSGSSEAVYAYY